jgi:outer membrane receptor protein involved in Fe transport
MRISSIVAAEAADSSAASSYQLEVITVTAQKMTERLIDVPIPLGVIQADTLIQQNLGQLKDYYTRVPGLSLYSDGNRTLVAIRGITTGIGNNPVVGITIDDVPIGSTTSQGLGDWLFPDLDPSTLQSVEVLRGPQGTLYGAASMGGLIRYVTAAPTFSGASGELSASSATVDHGGSGFGVRGSANVPLISDTLALRANAFYREDPGFITDIEQKRTQANIHKTAGGRASLLWQITPDVSYTLAATYQHRRSGGAATEATDIHGTPIYGDYLTANVPGTETANSTTAVFNGNLAANLGFADLTSITAFNRGSFSGPQDATDTFGRFLPFFFPDGLPEPLGTAVSNYQSTGKFSQEVRLTARRGGPIEWQLGGFFTNESDAGVQNVYVNSAATGRILAGAPQIYLTNAPGHYIEWAVFGTGTYHFTDQIDLQLGGRYSWQVQHNGLQVDGVLAAPSVADQSSKANVFTYSITPRYHISSDMMLYGRIATGYRPGGTNTSPGVPLSFKSDTTVNYEVGFKGDVIDQLLTIDASVFDIYWKDIQLMAAAPSGFSYVSNGGTARSNGVEFSTTLTPLEGLTIATNLDYTNARLTKDLPANGLLIGTNGSRLPYSAKFTASLSADQAIRITGDLVGNVGASFTYISDRYTDLSISAADPLTGAPLGVPPRFYLPAYRTFDLHAGVDYHDWNVSVYGHNLANEIGFVSAFRRDAITLLGNYGAQVIDPRSFGLSVTRRF